MLIVWKDLTKRIALLRSIKIICDESLDFRNDEQWELWITLFRELNWIILHVPNLMLIVEIKEILD